jgi:hypothetical protein
MSRGRGMQADRRRLDVRADEVERRLVGTVDQQLGRAEGEKAPGACHPVATAS